MMHLVIAVTDGEVTDILTDKCGEDITAEVVVIDSFYGEQNTRRIESLNRNAEYARLGFETITEPVCCYEQLSILSHRLRRLHNPAPKSWNWQRRYLYAGTRRAAH